MNTFSADYLFLPVNPHLAKAVQKVEAAFAIPATALNHLSAVFHFFQ